MAQAWRIERESAAHVGLGIQLQEHIESALHDALEKSIGSATPPRLASALRYAVFPGGARLRPQLTLAVALACEPQSEVSRAAEAAACAVELLHCASLVHDDMPCFDDAETRRGKPSVHRTYSDATALLVGDGLIVLAFDVLARGFASRPEALAKAIAALAEGAGITRGIIAGQAWEEEPSAPLEEYHRAKTASLFECAAVLGALASGADPAPWRLLGESIGRAYQAADDLRDAVGDAGALGKPTGRDEALGRPSLVRAYGLRRARERLRGHIESALSAVPEVAGAEIVTYWMRSFAASTGLR